MERLQAIATAISRGGAIVGGALLLAASIVICIDIALRYAFSLTIGGADDLSGYALAISSAWGFSAALLRDRKSTRLNSSHQIISYAVFCLKKKKSLPRTVIEARRSREARLSAASNHRHTS